jgi:hypothetical protein
VQDEKLETDDSFFDGSQNSMQSFLEQLDQEIDSLDDVSDAGGNEYIEAGNQITCASSKSDRDLTHRPTILKVLTSASDEEDNSETSSTCPNSKDDAAAILKKI